MATPGVSTRWHQSNNGDPRRIGFLDLPRELRDVIYAYAFHVIGAILIYPTDHFQARPKLRSKVVRYRGFGTTDLVGVNEQISIGLLRSCRQLHAECAPVLYGDNTFQLFLFGKAELALTYRKLIRYAMTTTEAAYRILDARDLIDTSHGWRNRFWPAVLHSGAQTLTQCPKVESITVSLKPRDKPPAWRPAFFNLGGRNADRRIDLAAAWMRKTTRFPSEILRDCLHLELETSPDSISIEEYAGSRFAPDEEEWDYTEFATAFELMKTLEYVPSDDPDPLWETNWPGCQSF